MLKSFLVSLAALLPVAAFAHDAPVHYVPHGFAAGFIHPLFGLDHLAVMFAVGYWLAGKYVAKQSTGLTAVFVTALILGAVSGVAGGVAIEQGILLSVFAAAAFVLAGRSYSPRLVAGVLATIAVFHGIAHGHEMPSIAMPLMYVAGFSAACALLVFVGYRANALLVKLAPQSHTKWVAASVACAGVLSV